MYNVDIQGGIAKALKSITVEDLNDSVLSPQQFQKFVDGLQEESKILGLARLQEMYSQIANIDRVEFLGRVLEAGRKANGEQNTPEGSNPAFHTNQLMAKELVGVTGLYDEAARRNIIKNQLENHLISIFSQQAAFDIAEYAMFADTSSDDEFLKQTDGWIKKAGNKVIPSSNLSVIEILNETIKAMPKKAIKDRSKVAFIVGFEIEDALRDAYAERETGLGDIAMTESGNLKFKGFPVIYDPVMDAGDERVILFTNPNNLVYGVFHRVTIEQDRVPKGRKTDFVLTTEVDAHYDNEEAAVVTFVME